MNWDELKKIKENKALYIAEKKSTMKQADPVMGEVFHVDTKGEAHKAMPDGEEEQGFITARVVINTTNLMDSHDDVHIPGLWNKTLKDRTLTYHLQEHQMKFDHVISDDVKASVKMISWKDLGYPYEGKTQALIFDSRIEKDRNELMYKQYLKGWVRNHSVGMQYVTLFMCVNSKDGYWAEEKANWDKYIEYVANADYAKEKGYFWAVTEAKMIEGSAVPIGSNQATPTISVKGPSEDTPDEEDKPDSRKSTIDPIELKNLLNQNLQKLWTKN